MINMTHTREINRLSLRQAKNLILTVMLSSIFFITQAIAAGVKNLDGIKKDIKVISKVLESSTDLDGSRSRLRVSGDYLAKQGIVLKVRFPGSRSFDFNFSEYGSFPSPSVVPDIFSSEADLEALVSDSMEIAELAMLAPDAPEVPMVDFTFGTRDTKERKILREQQRDLRSQQRALEKKARKLEKEARKKEQTKELKKQRAEFKVMREKMKAQSNEIKKQMLAITKESRDKHQKKLAIWTNNLLDNFCSYAPYPRNLPRGEHLTLVLTNATYVGNKKQDRVIVLNTSQLSACRDGKINGKELLAKSVNYSF